jgi:hypothetical protein
MSLSRTLRPGFFKLHLRRGDVPAQIDFADGLWSAWIDGRRIADPSPDPISAGVPRVWHLGERITWDEYRRLMGFPVRVAA